MAGREVALTAKRAGKQSKGAALCRKARLAAHPGRGEKQFAHSVYCSQLFYGWVNRRIHSELVSHQRALIKNSQ